eukprot:3585673-Rhodomonas_salina.1
MSSAPSVAMGIRAPIGSGAAARGRRFSVESAPTLTTAMTFKNVDGTFRTLEEVLSRGRGSVFSTSQATEAGQSWGLLAEGRQQEGEHHWNPLQRRVGERERASFQTASPSGSERTTAQLPERLQEEEDDEEDERGLDHDDQHPMEPGAASVGGAMMEVSLSVRSPMPCQGPDTTGLAEPNGDQGCEHLDESWNWEDRSMDSDPTAKLRGQIVMREGETETLALTREESGRDRLFSSESKRIASQRSASGAPRRSASRRKSMEG